MAASILSRSSVFRMGPPSGRKIDWRSVPELEELCRAGLGGCGVEALDVGAEWVELVDDALIAAIDVVDAVDDGFARSYQAGEDQAGASAEVGGLHGSAGQLRRAANDSATGVDGDIRAHADHFGGVEEAVLKDGFGDDGGAFGLRGQGHVLRLHVGGEAGIFLSSDIGSDKFGGPADTQCGVVDAFDGNTGLLEFSDDGAQVGWVAIRNTQVAVGEGPGDQVGARFDAVGDYGMLRAVEFLNAADAQRGCFVALNVGAHLAQQVNQVGDFGFAGAIF